MDLALYAATAVVLEGRSVRDVAQATGTSKSWVHAQATRYRAGGPAALVLGKRGPKRPANLTAAATEDEICRLRKELVDAGFDAGARTLAFRLGDAAPSTSTIHRVLRRRGLVADQPQKRPRSSWQRFEADLPNECWQSDMTHWQLEGNAKVEIINFIDDHSRAVLASTVVTVATAQRVVELFFSCTARFGFPAAVLTDNGAIYTARFRGSHTGFELELAALGITMKHGKPYHPQTQGKVERYHQTLKRFLRAQPEAATIAELQAQIDRFVLRYNEERPHQAHGRIPMDLWRGLDKAVPRRAGIAVTPATKVRHDIVDETGSVSLRYRSKMHHIGIGRAHKGARVVVLVADLDIRVVNLDGEVLRHFTLDPTRNYQPRSMDIV
jgi:transposase InsO family protein